MSADFLLAGTYNVECAQSLAIDLIGEEFKNAFIFYTSGVIRESSMRAVMNSVLFIRGSGLDATLETFGINVDSSILRETFEEWCTYYKRKWL